MTRLCEAVAALHDAGHRVVLVTGWHGDHCLGSALGEAASAEEAEDRALARLQQRLAAAAPRTRARSLQPPQCRRRRCEAASHWGLRGMVTTC